MTDLAFLAKVRNILSRVANHSWIAFILKGISRFRAKKTVSEIPSLLSVFTKSLDDSCKNNEIGFINIGHDLQVIHADALALTKQTLGTVKLTTDQSGDNMLAGITRVIEASLAEIKTCQSEVNADLEHVNTVAKHLDSLFAMCDLIEKIAVYLRVIGLNISIESSRSQSANDLFSVIGEETRKLSKQIVKIAAQIRADSSTALVSQTELRLSISEGMAHLQELSQDAEITMQEAARKIEQLIALSVDALAKAGKHSDNISHQVEEIVIGIQLHDSMSQRIDHINKSLNDAGKLCVLDKNKSMPEQYDTAHSIMLLQRSQLQHPIAEIRAVYRKTRKAFEMIDDEVEQLVNNLSVFSVQANPLLQKGENEGGQDDPFEALTFALEHFNRLIDRGRGLVDQIREMADHASQTSVQLLGHMEQVRKISLETLLIALNSIIKAEHLGETGRALEILSQEMKRVSDQTNGFVAGVENIIEAINTSVKKLQIQMPSKGDVQGQSKILDIGINNIVTTYEKFKQNYSEAFMHAENIKSTISSASTRLEFLPAMAEKLDEHLKKLSAIGQILVPWTRDKAYLSSEERVRIASRYTMQKERKVHKEVIGKAGELPEDDSNALAEKSLMLPLQKGTDKTITEDNELGNNVELF